MMRALLSLLLLMLVLSRLSTAAPISDPGNPHNMSSLATHSGPKAISPDFGGTEEICVFCHTPHGAAPQTPLWSRPDPDMMGSFPIYNAVLIKNAPALTGYSASSGDYPNGASRMCLSCHDGVTSIGVLLGAPITMESGSETIYNAAFIIDLATSHPISFNYNQAVVNYIDPPNTNYRLPTGLIDTPLSGGRMQCTTCHDPHEDTRGLASYDNLPFWRHQGNATSYVDVCNECHLTPPNSPSLPHALP